jgi:nucleoid-associated protein YejK
MGSFLSFVEKQGEIKTVCPVINMSLSKIRQFHGTFKQICDQFAINLVEFENIFDETEQTFVIWDTDGNGKQKII